MAPQKDKCAWVAIKVFGFVLFFLNIAFGLLSSQEYFPSWLFSCSLAATVLGFIAFLVLALWGPTGINRQFIFSVFKGYIVSLAMIVFVLVLQILGALPGLLFGKS